MNKLCKTCKEKCKQKLFAVVVVCHQYKPIEKEQDAEYSSGLECDTDADSPTKLEAPENAKDNELSGETGLVRKSTPIDIALLQR